MGRTFTLFVLFILMTITFIAPTVNSSKNQLIVPQSRKHPFHLSSDSEIIGFTANKLLSIDDSNYDHHVEPTLAISDNGTLFAGWKNSETAIGSGARVSFAKSTDGGVHWSLPFNMPMFNVTILQNQFGICSEPSIITRQSDPWLFWHNGMLYYAYLEFAPDVPWFTQITVARSNNTGQSWNPVSASYGSGFADKETMWVDNSSGTLYVAYDDIESNVTIRITRSTDNGESFDEIGVVGPPDPGHLAPYVTTNNEGHVYIASSWFGQLGGTLYLSSSEVMGVTFSEQQAINYGFFADFTSVDGRPAKVTMPILRFDQNNRLYVLWADTYESDSRTFDIYLRYSDDFGIHWSNRILINPVVEGDQWQPDMDIDSEGTLHITYYDERDGFYKPYYRTIQFTGESRNESLMSEPIAIANANTSSEFTRPGDYFTIRLDSNDIPHVVWTDGRNDEMDIYYAHGVRPLPTTTTTPTSNTVTNYTTTNTTDLPDTRFLEILVGIGVGLTLVCIVIVIIYYRSRR
jgi:hypothetical protein